MKTALLLIDIQNDYFPGRKAVPAGQGPDVLVDLDAFGPWQKECRARSERDVLDVHQRQGLRAKAGQQSLRL